jgi:hypothetical protein
MMMVRFRFPKCAGFPPPWLPGLRVKRAEGYPSAGFPGLPHTPLRCPQLLHAPDKARDRRFQSRAALQGPGTSGNLGGDLLCGVPVLRPSRVFMAVSLVQPGLLKDHGNAQGWPVMFFRRA